MTRKHGKMSIFEVLTLVAILIIALAAILL